MDIAGKRPETVDIHPTALVDERARIGENVRIGPWCQIGPHVTLGAGVHLHASVIVDGHTTLGDGVEVYPFVTIGMAPQDLKYAGEPTLCEVGAGTVIRENVTIHRGTAQGEALTRVGKNCLIMANAHVAHDCLLGDYVIVVNNVVMGGHVQIGDGARVMGSAAVHQFVRVGRGAVVGGVCGVEMDVIPYGSVLGNRARLVGLNWVGLKRSGVTSDEMQAMRKAFRTLYPRHGQGNDVLEARIAHVRQEYGHLPRIAEMLDFMEAPSHRGLTRAARPDAQAETEGA
ncbi:acyl-ACP--UDP-N-acetylglucosamine O-acyltransferase [Neokomagataea thailandica]|uniref:UDP-N-acetylglucosamine acyltransferase n=1 Tax=Neokomagataea tanensis NBRC 106556 TaxID=1223519 RepID=A0ABQ0QGA8_9PROT|nr:MULTISPECIES: acyl-ACP--UDP-N-acetylglucosamine O-acyltransferase [Neokomagataea]GBR43785.1 UDP-N-acetylglucosamine acyltransferase [Neokomagataea tanensis NBRC 106556]